MTLSKQDADNKQQELKDSGLVEDSEPFVVKKEDTKNE